MRLFAVTTRRVRMFQALFGLFLTPGGVLLLAQDRPWTLVTGAITLGVGVDIPREALTPEQDRELGAFLAGLASVRSGSVATGPAAGGEPEGPRPPTVRSPQP